MAIPGGYAGGPIVGIASGPSAGNTGDALFLPASVSPGQTLTGTAAGRGPGGSTIIQTPAGSLALQTELFLRRGTEIVLHIEQSAGQTSARIVTVDGLSLGKYLERLSPPSTQPAAAPAAGTPAAATSAPPPQRAEAAIEARFVTPPPPEAVDRVRMLLPPEVAATLRRAGPGSKLEIAIVNVLLPQAAATRPAETPSASPSTPPMPSSTGMAAAPSALPASSSISPGDQNPVVANAPSSDAETAESGAVAPLKNTPALPGASAPASNVSIPLPPSVAPPTMSNVQAAFSTSPTLPETLAATSSAENIPDHPAVSAIGTSARPAATGRLPIPTGSEQPLPVALSSRVESGPVEAATASKAPIPTSMVAPAPSDADMASKAVNRERATGAAGFFLDTPANDSSPVSLQRRTAFSAYGTPLPPAGTLPAVIMPDPLSPTGNVPSAKAPPDAAPQATNIPKAMEIASLSSPNPGKASQSPETEIQPQADAGRLLTRTASLASTVLGRSGSEMLVQTPLGTLRFFDSPDFPPGTQLGLRIDNAVEAAPNVADAPDPARFYPALSQVAALPIDPSSPPLLTLPGIDGRGLVAGIVQLFAAVRGGGTGRLLDEKQRARIEALAPGLAAQAHRELGQIQSQAEIQNTSGWNQMSFPLVFQQQLAPIELFWKRERADPARFAEGDSEHFLVDVSLPVWGKLQLDGLVKKNRPLGFDLVIRSERPIGAEAEREIGTIYRDASAISGFVGQLRFHQGAGALVPLPGHAYASPEADHAIVV